MKTNIHFLLYLLHFFLVLEMFQIKVLKKIKTHIYVDNSFSKTVPFMRECGNML